MLKHSIAQPSLLARAPGYSGFMRAFTESTSATALGDDPQKEKMLDAIYQRVEARYLADPTRSEFQFILISELLKRL